MIGHAMLWAFFGPLGPRELVVVALVALVLYGRSGVIPGRHARMLRPWLSMARRGPGAPPSPAVRSKWGGRTFWFLTVVAATAVAAWIVTRTIILATAGSSH